MRLAVLLSSILSLSAASASASIVVTVSPVAQTAPLGSAATVQIGISGLGLGAAPSLGAYDLNIAFNPAVLSFTGLTFGDPIQGDQLDLSGLGTISDFSNSPVGSLEFFEISLDPSSTLDTQQSDHFVLATLVFNAVGPGSSFLQPGVNSIADSSGAALTATLQSGSINVTTTPEPNTFALLFPLVALVAWQSRQRRMP